MARSKNCKKKNIHNMKKSRKYKHLGGGVVTIEPGSNKDKYKRQYFAIKFQQQPVVKTIYVIFEPNLLSYKVWNYTTTPPTGDNFTPDNESFISIVEFIKNLNTYLITSKVSLATVKFGMLEFIQQNDKKSFISSIFGKNTGDIVGFMKELIKNFEPILNSNRQLQCLRYQMLEEILKRKNTIVYNEISKDRAVIIQKKDRQSYDPADIRRITNFCLTEINKIPIHATNEPGKELLEAQAKIKLLETKQKENEQESTKEKEIDRRVAAAVEMDKQLIESLTAERDSLKRDKDKNLQHTEEYTEIKRKYEALQSKSTQLETEKIALTSELKIANAKVTSSANEVISKEEAMKILRENCDEYNKTKEGIKGVLDVVSEIVSEASLSAEQLKLVLARLKSKYKDYKEKPIKG